MDLCNGTGQMVTVLMNVTNVKTNGIHRVTCHLYRGMWREKFRGIKRVVLLMPQWFIMVNTGFLNK